MLGERVLALSAGGIDDLAELGGAKPCGQDLRRGRKAAGGGRVDGQRWASAARRAACRPEA